MGRPARLVAHACTIQRAANISAPGEPDDFPGGHCDAEVNADHFIHLDVRAALASEALLGFDEVLDAAHARIAVERKGNIDVQHVAARRTAAAEAQSEADVAQQAL